MNESRGSAGRKLLYPLPSPTLHGEKGRRNTYETIILEEDAIDSALHPSSSLSGG